MKSVDREGSMTWDQKGTGSAVPPRQSTEWGIPAVGAREGTRQKSWIPGV